MRFFWDSYTSSPDLFQLRLSGDDDITARAEHAGE